MKYIWMKFPSLHWIVIYVYFRLRKCLFFRWWVEGNISTVCDGLSPACVWVCVQYRHRLPQVGCLGGVPDPDHVHPACMYPGADLHLSAHVVHLQTTLDVESCLSRRLLGGSAQNCRSGVDCPGKHLAWWVDETHPKYKLAW